MTSYLHYNQGETHFCAEDLLIAWQCQSLHEDTEADCVWQASATDESESAEQSEQSGGGKKGMIRFEHFQIITVTQR